MRWFALMLMTFCTSHLSCTESKKHQNYRNNDQDLYKKSVKSRYSKARRGNIYRKPNRKSQNNKHNRLHPIYHDVPGQRRSSVFHGTAFYQKTHDDSVLQRFVDPRAIAITRMLVRRGNIFADHLHNRLKSNNNARSAITHYIDPKKFGQILLDNLAKTSEKRMDIDINVTGKRREKVDPSKLGLAILKLMFGNNANLVIQKSSANTQVNRKKEDKDRETERKQFLARKQELSQIKKQTLNELISQQDNLIKQQGKQSKLLSNKQVLAPMTRHAAQFDTDMDSSLMKAVTSLHSALEQVQAEKKEKAPGPKPIVKTLATAARKSTERSTRNQLAEQINELLRRLKPLAQNRNVEKKPKVPLTVPFRGKAALTENRNAFLGNGRNLYGLNKVFASAKSVTPNENLVQMSTAPSTTRDDKTSATKDISSVLQFLDNEDKDKPKNIKTPTIEIHKPSSSNPEMSKQIEKVQQSVMSMMHIAQSMEKAAKEIATKIKTTPKPITTKPQPKTIAPNRKSWVLLKLPKTQAEDILPFTNNDIISQIPFDENPFNKEVIGLRPTGSPLLNEEKTSPKSSSIGQTKLRLADSIQNLIAALRSSLKTVTQDDSGTGQKIRDPNNEIHENVHNNMNLVESPSMMKSTGIETMQKLFTEDTDQDANRIKVAHASDITELKEDLETFAQRGLQAHNGLRELHHSKPLRWSDELATQAEKLAYDMAMKGKVQRSEVAPVLGYGENVARISHVAFNNAGVAATKLWYNQIANYSFNDPRLNAHTDAFSQVVWAGTTQLGMGCAKDMQTNDLYVVALYKPRGNIVKELRHNVMNKGKPVDMYSTIFKRNEMLWKRIKNKSQG